MARRQSRRPGPVEARRARADRVKRFAGAVFAPADLAETPRRRRRGRLPTGRAVPVVAALLLASLALACSGSPTEPSEAHGPEGMGGESGESGTRYAVGDEARELRGGVELIMRFDQGTERFTGTTRNTTSQTVRDVRVEIHLSNGVELGPTPRVDLSAGETRPVELDARGQAFDWWTLHVEVGSGSS